MIRNDEQRLIHFEIIGSRHARPRQQPHQRTHYCLNKRRPRPLERHQPRPCRIYVTSPSSLDGLIVRQFIAGRNFRFAVRRIRFQRSLRCNPRFIAIPMPVRFARNQPPQRSQRLHSIQDSILGNKSQPVLDGRCQLHAPQAVQVQIFRQVQFIPYARMFFAAHLRNHRQKPVVRPPQSAVPISMSMSAGSCSRLNPLEPLRHNLASHLAG